MVTPWGAKLTVIAEDASHRADFLVTGINWEHETDVLRRLTRPGSVILDVGANFGYCTSLFASGCAPGGRVTAIEPEPAMFELLSRNVVANGYRNVSCVNAAAGSAGGTVRLWCSATNLGCHSLNRDLVPAAVRTAAVPMIRLDELCASDSGPERVDLVKVDVEGWEHAVLAGADGLLRDHKPILWLEFWPDGLRRCGVDPEDLIGYIRGHGYSITMFDLLSGTHMTVPGTAPVEYCDRMTTCLRAQGNTALHGIVYLLAQAT